VHARSRLTRLLVGAVAVAAVAGSGTTTAGATAAPPGEFALSMAGDRLQKALARSPHYAGVRASADRSGMDVYSTSPRNAALRDAARRAARDVPVRFLAAEHTWAELLALSARITADSADLAARGHTLRFVAPSVLRNSLEVGLAHPTEAAAAAFTARYGPAVRVVQGDDLLPTSSRLNDVSPWNGGDFIAFDNGQGCTSGPAVKNASGKTYLLTTGHCFFPHNTIDAYAWTGRYGYRVFNGAWDLGGDAQTFMGWAAAEYGYGYDSALIDTAASALVWRTANPNDQSTGVPQKAVFASTENTSMLCVSGAYSGERCANEVDQIEVTRWYSGEAPYLFPDSYISHVVHAHNSNGVDAGGPGDSGAAVYTVQTGGLYLTGVLLGGIDNNSNMDCTRLNNLAARTGQCSNRFAFANLSSVMNHRGVSLVTR
jgi:hypothetical protein